MSHPYPIVILVGLCGIVAACTDAPNDDPTAPEPQAEVLDAGRVSLLTANSWTTKSSLPAPLQRAVATASNNIIYVIGGTKADGSLSNQLRAYTIATNTWSTLAPLPSRRTELHGASVINGRIYVTGGFNTTGMTATSTLYVYHIATNSWARRADMPQPGACGAQGVIHDLLYVYTAGVACGAPDTHKFFRYNPVTNTWTTLPSPPTTHTWGVGRVIGTKFYLVGGRDAVEELNLRQEVYNSATNSWTSRASIPSEQLRSASGVLNGKLYVAGGGRIGTPLATLRMYDPATNTWTTKHSMPTARWATFGTPGGGLLWVIGGLRNNNSGITAKVEAYTP